MKAKNLKDAYKAFYPTPLEEAGAVESFYIKRGDGLVKLFSTFGDDSIKVLFSGQRGTGKTTELNYTETALASKYTILNLKIGKYLSTPLTNSQDISIAILTATAQDLKLKESLGDISFVIKRLLNIKRNYISVINDALEEIKKKTGKSVLLFIDDLDKGIHRVDKILSEEGGLFTQIACSLALVVPIKTIYSGMAIRDWFSHVEVLPIIPIINKNGERYAPGLNMLKELVFRRMESGLITDKSLELAAEYSGGVFRYLVKIIQESAFNALQADKDHITEDNVWSSIKNMQSEFGRIIGIGDYDKLNYIRKKKNLINIEADVRYIENDIVLEYQNDSRWVDIHPVVKDLLPRDKP